LDGRSAVARPLPTHRTTQTQYKYTLTSMPRVGFELTNTVFERVKTIQVLDRAAIVIQDITSIFNVYRFLCGIIIIIICPSQKFK
jgi:hypothetical protein